MINYKIYKNTNQRSSAYGKWYARAVVNRTFGVSELAEHMARHNTPFSAGAIKGILTDAVACIKELVMDGTAVKLDDLAIFSIGLNSLGAQSPKDITASYIKLHLRARATGKLATSRIKLEKQLKELDGYIDPKVQNATDDTTEGEKTA